MTNNWVLIGRFANVTEAHIARGVLEAQGIPALVVEGITAGATPYALLFASKERAEEAVKILRNFPHLFTWWNEV